MASVGDDRRFIIEQFQYLYGRAPTTAELSQGVSFLKQYSRSYYMGVMERFYTDEAVTRLYKEILGREPKASELASFSRMLAEGKLTRESLKQRLADSAEALLKEPEPDAPTTEQENARDYLNSVLEQYGLEGMGDWAWEQIQQGYTPERVLQNLRDTDTYKQRFAGMEARKAAGLPAISEAQYIAYETDVRQTMRAAGLPADFYDQPDDFVQFMAADVSLSEVTQRINEGYLAAAQAPAEVRAQLQQMYGVSEGSLAAYFLDPDRALPVIQRQFTAAQISGAAGRTGYGNLTVDEAERLSALGVTTDQAQQGFSALARSSELFQALPGQQEGLITRADQQSAVFGGDAEAAAAIERRGKERVSAGSGAQSFGLGQGGVAGLAREP